MIKGFHVVECLCAHLSKMSYISVSITHKVKMISSLTLRAYSSGFRVKALPPMLNVILGMFGRLLQLIMYSPLMKGAAPMASLSFLISAVGPAIREVPVSAMAAHPLAQKSPLPATLTLRTTNSDQTFNCIKCASFR